MGYTNDTGMAAFVSPIEVTPTVGTWAMAVAAHLWTLNKTAGADTSVLKIPLKLPSNSMALKGSYLKSIDIFWINATADLTDMSVEVYLSTLPAQGGALATMLQASSYDALHLTAAARKTQAQHKMTITLTTPVWLDDDNEAYVELTVVAAATSTVKLQGARANYTLRV
jgi:hypothetical protein